MSGPLADRIGPAVVAAGGMAFVAAGLIAAAQAATLWQIYIAYGLGVGIGAGTLVTPPVANWLIQDHCWRDAMTYLVDCRQSA